MGQVWPPGPGERDRRRGAAPSPGTIHRLGFPGALPLPILKTSATVASATVPLEDKVPLSEHEQRLLEQMERALHAEDPKLASVLRGVDPRRHQRRRLLLGAIGFVTGMALLVTGAAVPLFAVGVVGFVVMLAAALFVLSSWRQLPAAPAGSAPGGPVHSRRPRTKVRFMDRVEDRWRRRRDDRGF